MVVEALAGGLVEDRLERSSSLPPLRLSCSASTFALVGASTQSRCLGRLEHAVEAAQHGERQDDAAVLGGLVGAAQQVGDAPDEADLVREAVHERSPFRRAAATRLIPTTGFVAISQGRRF